MEEPNMIILLLHGGKDHIPSQIILDFLENKKIHGLSKIYVGSNKTKNRILNNKYNIEIKHFPCIVIKKDDYPPEIYPATIKSLKTLARKLNNIF